MTHALTIETKSTPLGDLLLVADAAGRLYATEFADCEDRLHRLLGRKLGIDGCRLTTGKVPAATTKSIASYFAGDLAAIHTIAVHKGGTAFQESVWTALRDIQPGQPTNYATLANTIGRPTAVRAVGAANGSNPNCIVIPCHRLMGADGSLTGYSGGLARKRWLLDHEAKHAR